jgi:phosphocarrier protein
MTLGAEKGTKVVVTADDQSTLDTIVKLVESDLDAE